MRASAPDQGADLVLEHRAFVLRLCQVLLRHADDSEDAAQQVLLNAYRALAGGLRPLNVRAWLAQIARNECRSRGRTAAARAEVSLPEALPNDGLDPSDLVAQREVLARLRQEFANLPERQRQALLLRELRGLSYGELAEVMHETQPAAESLLQRARRRLAERLDDARRPLVGIAIAFDSMRDALVRLAAGPTATETTAAGAAAVIAAKVAAVGIVAVGVGVTTGDVGRPSHAVPEPGAQIASPPSDARSTSPLVPRPSGAASSGARDRRRDGDDSPGEKSGGGSGRNGASPGRTDDASSDAGSSSSGSSGSDSGGSGSSGPDLSGSGSSGSGSDSPSSGPGTSSSGSGSSGSGSDASSGEGGSGTSGSGTSGSGD